MFCRYISAFIDEVLTDGYSNLTWGVIFPSQAWTLAIVIIQAWTLEWAVRTWDKGISIF